MRKPIVTTPQPTGSGNNPGILWPQLISSRERILTFLVDVIAIAGLCVTYNLQRGGHNSSEPGFVEKSIGVLPFVMASDSKWESFCNGITEESLNHLAKIKTLIKVTSRTSVKKYKGAIHHIPSIAKELRIATILEGRVRINSPT